MTDRISPAGLVASRVWGERALPVRAARFAPHRLRLCSGRCDVTIAPWGFVTGLCVRMEMKRIGGGNLRAAGYDERARKLVVELTSGTLEYTGVPSEVWRRFSTAASPWSYYRDNIDEEFPSRRVR